MTKFIVLFIFVITSQSGLGRNIDSLLNELNQVKSSDKLNLDQKIEFYLKRAETFWSHGDSAETALIYHEVAKLFAKKREYLKTLDFTSKAANLRNELSDTIGYRKSLFNIGYYNLKMNQHALAINAFKNIVIQNKADDTHLKALNELAIIYMTLGDYDLANSYLNELEQFLNLTDNLQIIEHYWLNRAHIVYLLKDGVKASQLIESYDKLSQEHSRYFIEGEAAYNLALNLQALGRTREAISSYIKSIETFQDYGVEWYVGPAYSTIGVCYKKLNNYKLAHTYLDKALKNSVNIYDKSVVYDNLGDLYLAQIQYKKAYESYDKAIALLLTSYDLTENSRFEELSPVKIDYLLYKSDKANALLEGYKATGNEIWLNEAAEIYAEADKLIDDIKRNHKEAASKLFWREKVKPLYNNALEAAYELGDKEQAFYYFEKSKAVLLLDELLDNISRDRSGLSQHLLDQEFSLKQQIVDLEVASVEAENEGEKDSLKSLITSKKIEFDQFLTTLEDKHPEYVRGRYQTKVKSREEITSKFLKANTSLVNFIWTDSSVYRLYLDKEHYFVDQLPVDFEFRKSLEKFLAATRSPFGDRTALSDFNELSAGLYKALFNGISEYLQESIIVLPDGYLNYIPFDALISGNGRVMISDHTISYGFSASTYFNPTPNKRYKSAMGFAPETYAGNELAELSFSSQELAALKPFRPKNFSDTAANKKNLLSQLTEKGLIHISSHATAGDSTYDYPWVAAHAEKVFLPEIYNHSNNADLVVLSACETVLGKEVQGEGIISLARAFIHSGAQSVMASLWKVNEQSTSEIVENFYGYLKKGETKAQALRKAKLDFTETNPTEAQSPYYWAGLVYIGEDEKLNMKRRSNTWKYLLAGGALGLFLLFGLRGSRRKKA